MTSTLLLAQDTWDLVLDASGNIAVASAPYSMAQDVASACRLFAGELWYDTTQGVPYDTILAQRPPTQYIAAQLEKAAMTVPNVASARCIISGFTDRKMTGQIQVTDVNGASLNVEL